MAEQMLIKFWPQKLFHRIGENAAMQQVLFVILFWSLIYAASLAQDYAGSSINSAAYYFSESVLFNTFWLFFIPFFLIVISSVRRTWFLDRGSAVKGAIAFVIALMLTLAHLAAFALFINLASGITLPHIFSFAWVMNEVLTEDFYLVFSVYGLLLFVSLWFYADRKSEHQSLAYARKLTVRDGKKIIPVNTSDIRWIDTESPYIAIHTAGKTYLHSSSLTKIQRKLDPEKFVRIHRSVIVNIDSVAELKSRLNGDYDVKLKGDGTTVRMSRSYSPDVKKRLT